MSTVSEPYSLPPAAYLCPKQAAAHLSLTTKHLATLRATGEGPPFSKPTYKTILYKVSDLDEWLARHRFRNTAEALAKPAKGGAL